MERMTDFGQLPDIIGGGAGLSGKYRLPTTSGGRVPPTRTRTTFGSPWYPKGAWSRPRSEGWKPSGFENMRTPLQTSRMPRTWGEWKKMLDLQGKPKPGTIAGRIKSGLGMYGMMRDLGFDVGDPYAWLGYELNYPWSGPELDGWAYGTYVTPNHGWTACAYNGCNGPPTHVRFRTFNVGCAFHCGLVGQALSSSAYQQMNTGFGGGVRYGHYVRKTAEGAPGFFIGDTVAEFNIAGSPTVPPYTRVARPLPYAFPRHSDGKLATPKLVPSPEPFVDQDNRIAAKPAARRSIDMRFDGKGPPRVTVGEHLNKPGDKARKRKSGKAMAMAIRMMHSLSELGDFAAAMFEALPKELQGKGKRGLAYDLGTVIDNWQAFLQPEVASKAILNLAFNHFSDKLIGTLFGSNWRTGVRTDNYGGTAWVGGGYGAPSVSSSPFMSPM